MTKPHRRKGPSAPNPGHFAPATNNEQDGTLAGEGRATRQSAAPLARQQLHSLSMTAFDVAHHVSRDGDLNPPYQRGTVWSEDQRIALVKSWLQNIPVPAVIINRRIDGAWPEDDAGYPVGGFTRAVVDGKQRIETAIAWFDDRLAVPASWFDSSDIRESHNTDDGPYVSFSGLHEPAQRRVSRAQMPVVEAALSSMEEEAALYLLVNGGGTSHSDSDLDRARVIIDPSCSH